MEEVGEKSFILKQGIKGGLFAYILCTVLVLILALIVKLFQISVSALPIINQILKGVSIAIGVYAAVSNGKGILKGSIAALLFVVLSAVTFTLLGGEFSWKQTAIDLAMSVLLGGISGTIAGNRKS